MIVKKLRLDGLSCADCSLKLEEKINQLAGVEKAEINFTSQKLKLVIAKREVEDIIAEVKELIKREEPQIEIKGDNQTNNQAGKQKLRLQLIRLISGGAIFGLAFFIDLAFELELALYLSAYLIVGSKVLTNTVKNISQAKIFDENFLMTIATTGAFLIGEYPEAVAVMLFFEVGEFFKDKAVNRSRASIKELMNIQADYAHLKQGDELLAVEPNELEIGDKIVIKPGEKIPQDGKVIKGSSRVDNSILTGESLPEKVAVGDEVLSGGINQHGLLTVKVTKEFAESTVNKILDLVENAASKKAPTERFITKFSRYYTPVVVGAAALLAILPPLLLPEALFSDWIYRALIFLVISCPCALVISIPLGFFGGIGSASRQGILVKGGNYLAALNDLDTVVFDKTGTLSQGVFAVEQIKSSNGYSKDELLRLAAQAELNSNHPIAKAILAAYDGSTLSAEEITSYREQGGRGVEVKLGAEKILLGNKRLLAENDIEPPNLKSEKTVVYLAHNNTYAGYIEIADKLKADAVKVIEQLKSAGIKEIVMLTGDNQATAKNVAAELGIDTYYAELLPEDKVEQVERLIAKQEQGEKLAFVGDGINDAPVLARSDVAIAMGALGSDAAIEAADVVLMNDRLSNLPQALEIANFTQRIVWQNIVLALGVKTLVLLLGSFGMATMWGAIFADV